MCHEIAKTVFTQVLSSNEKGSVGKLRELLRTALHFFFVLHLSAYHEVREPSGGNKARRICSRH